MIRSKIAPFATPDFIQSAPGLPKTRSGKIMRRILKKIANDERDLGDISTMADSSVVEVLDLLIKEFNFVCGYLRQLKNLLIAGFVCKT